MINRRRSREKVDLKKGRKRDVVSVGRIVHTAAPYGTTTRKKISFEREILSISFSSIDDSIS